MESAIYCGMESAQGAGWNHGNAVYGIKPKERYTQARDAMPSQSDGFHAPHFARRLHTNPLDWIEKSKSCDLLFSGRGSWI